MITEIPTTARIKKDNPRTESVKAVIIRMIRKITRTQENDASPS